MTITQATRLAPPERRSYAEVLAICVVHAIIPDVGGKQDETAIDKRPVLGDVEVHRFGLTGDTQCDIAHHGGEGKAVYAYAQEDAEWWAADLERELPPGRFGENLRTRGLDVTNALLGERWRIGTTLLEVTCPRTPCLSFQGFWGVPRLIKRFLAYGAPGAYLRVLEEGQIRAGDGIEIAHRPDHDVTLGLALRALTVERALIGRLAPALYALPDRDRPKVAHLVEHANS
ncbi:MAG: MOSC domain-containing protein [Actinomycetota bacterium]|nr:MOSC domain-containing protein [Actinomycetota bacterium]